MNEIRRIFQVVLVVVGVFAAAGAIWRWYASQEGEPVFAGPHVSAMPASGPVGLTPFLEIRGFDEAGEITVLLCPPAQAPEGCAELGTGTDESRVRSAPIPARIGDTDVTPGMYVIRAGTGPVASLPVRGEFEIVPFVIGETVDHVPYSGLDLRTLRLGGTVDVARRAPCRTGVTRDDRLVLGPTVFDPVTGVSVVLDIDATEFAFGPRGDRLAYVTEDSKEIRIAAPDGSEAVTVVREARGLLSSLSWAPEGDFLAYSARSEPGVSGGPGPPTIVIFNTINGQTRSVGSGQAVAWSPVGDRLAVEVPGGMIELSDLEGGRRRIAEGTKPNWSPDGSILGYIRGGSLHLTRAGDPQPVRFIDADVCGFTFTASGRRLAVTLLEDDQTRLVLRPIRVPEAQG